MAKGSKVEIQEKLLSVKKRLESQRKHLINTTEVKEITEDKDDKLQSSFFLLNLKSGY